MKHLQSSFRNTQRFSGQILRSSQPTSGNSIPVLKKTSQPPANSSLDGQEVRNTEQLWNWRRNGQQKELPRGSLTWLSRTSTGQSASTARFSQSENITLWRVQTDRCVMYRRHYWSTCRARALVFPLQPDEKHHRQLWHDCPAKAQGFRQLWECQRTFSKKKDF